MSETAGAGVLAAVVAVVVLGLRRARDGSGPHAAAADRVGAALVLVGPEQARGQAAVTTADSAPAPGDDVRANGRDWTVSETEDLAGDVRVWLVPAATPARRQLLDAQVSTIAAELRVELERVSYEALGELGGADVPYTPDVQDIALLRVRRALMREADMLRPWLVAVGVTSAADLPGDAWMPQVRHVGDGSITCDVEATARRIAEHHVYG